MSKNQRILTKVATLLARRVIPTQVAQSVGARSPGAYRFGQGHTPADRVPQITPRTATPPQAAPAPQPAVVPRAAAASAFGMGKVSHDLGIAAAHDLLTKLASGLPMRAGMQAMASGTEGAIGALRNRVGATAPRAPLSGWGPAAPLPRPPQRMMQNVSPQGRALMGKLQAQRPAVPPPLSASQLAGR